MIKNIILLLTAILFLFMMNSQLFSAETSEQYLVYSIQDNNIQSCKKYSEFHLESLSIETRANGNIWVLYANEKIGVFEDMAQFSKYFKIEYCMQNEDIHTNSNTIDDISHNIKKRRVSCLSNVSTNGNICFEFQEKHSGSLHIEIRNLNGVLISELNVSNVDKIYTLNTKKYPKGTYFVTFRFDTYFETLQIMNVE